MKNATPGEVFAEVYSALEPGAFRDSDGNYDFTEAQLLLSRVRDVATLERIALAATQLAGMASLAYGDRFMLEQRRRTGTFAAGDLVAARPVKPGYDMITGNFARYGSNSDEAFITLGRTGGVFRVHADSLRHIGDDGVILPPPEVAAV